jgi:hypothetical protein
MFEYIICAILLVIIVSIIKEYLVYKRLQMEDGIELKKGMCVFKQGYGKIDVGSKEV